MSVTKMKKHEAARGKYYLGSVFKVIMKVAWPVMLLAAFSALYTLTDSIMSSNLVEYDNGLTPSYMIGFVTPVLNVMFALISMFFVGGGIIYTKSLSKNDYDSVNKAIGQQMLMTVFYCGIAVAIMMPASEAYLDMILRMRPDEMTVEMANDARWYMIIVAIAVTFLGLNEAYIRALRSEGKGPITIVVKTFAVSLNLALNWVFMGVMDLGYKGAGLATLTSTAFVFVITFILIKIMYKKEYISLNLKLAHFKPDRLMMKLIAIFGVTAVVRRLVSSYMAIMFSTLVTTLNGEGWREILTVGSQSIEFVSVFALGLGQAIGMLVAYWHSVNKMKNIKEAIYYGMSLTFIIQIVFSALLMGTSKQIFELFNISHLLSADHYKAYYIIVSGMFLSSLILLMPYVYASLKQIKRGFLHVGLVFVVYNIVMLSMYFGVYVPTGNNIFVFMSFPIAFAFCFLVTVPTMLKEINELKNNKITGENPDFDKEVEML